MEEARKRQHWLLAAGLALALLPTRLVDVHPRLVARAEPPAPRAAAPELEPLALTSPDLMAAALRVEVGPSFSPHPPPEPPAPRALAPEAGLRAPKLAKRVAEPPLELLFGISLASAAGASRGRRRSPRWRWAR